MLSVAGFCSTKTNVLTGIDVLQQEGFAPLKGKRIGVITNHTGIDRDGKSTVQVLFSAPGVKLSTILTPEHGFSGAVPHGEKIESSSDPATGLPVYSLYGKTKRPTSEMLAQLDALVFDIQDIGTRFYTYLTTMAYALEEAAKSGIEFIVLDRPVPITGSILEGPALDPSIQHFTAHYQVPIRHGMTPAEIATFYNETKGLKAKLSVIRMRGWKRELWFDETGLPWNPTSPNIRTLEAALLYPGVGCFESTNFSVGRGTPTPFSWVGAPWLKAKKVTQRLNSLRLPGVKFSRQKQTPNDDIYKGKTCDGIRIEVTDRNAVRPFDIFVHIACLLREYHPKEFEPRWEEVRRMVGNDEFKNLYLEGKTAQEILSQVQKSVDSFSALRPKYLLY
ncbi:MAG: DUF1343 domain-containing protein [Elusimicrobia bacterium]|nr:DUF1343 domain-containing protein [Elusimicrobiota bacterium]